MAGPSEKSLASMGMVGGDARDAREARDCEAAMRRGRQLGTGDAAREWMDLFCRVS